MRLSFLYTLTMTLMLTIGGCGKYQPLAVYNKYGLDMDDMNVRSEGRVAYLRRIGYGGPMIISNAIPANAQDLHVSWTNTKTGTRVVHEHVTIEPSLRPPNKWGLEVELVIQHNGDVTARRRPFGSRRDE